MQQAYQGQGASKLRMLRASQTDSLSLRRKAITPTRFPPWQPRSWICKGRRACFCPLATLAAAPAPSDNSTAVPVLDLDKVCEVSPGRRTHSSRASLGVYTCVSTVGCVYQTAVQRGPTGGADHHTEKRYIVDKIP